MLLPSLREPLIEYLLHHHRNVWKEGHLPAGRERGAAGENNISLPRTGQFLLHGFAVMPEHLHVLLTPADGQTVERCVQCIKGGCSFSVRLQFAGQVWQAGFHEHRIRDWEDFRNQIEYVTQNPQRRRLTDYPFVHTNYLDRLDPCPRHVHAGSQIEKSLPQGLKSLRRNQVLYEGHGFSRAVKV
jgi:REP element-mobilizing transposase RayT